MVIQRILFGNGKNIEKRSFTLNVIAGLVNALQAIVMLMLVTRITGIIDAGILTIAFAISNLMMTIGKFGMRNFQVTDSEQKFSFKTYLKSRIITVLLMGLFSLCYILYSYFILRTSFYKVLIIFLICVIYMVDSLEDVFAGAYQQKGRLDVGSAMFCIRWVSTISVFALILIITNSLLYSIIGALITTVIISALMIKHSFASFSINLNDESVGCIELLKKSFPLCVGAFLMIYLANAPKYEIEAYLSDEIQACYGFVAMPVFVIELLNNFLYQPKLIEISRCWNENDLKRFLNFVLRQCITLFVVIFICEIGAYVMGIPVLSFMYNTELIEYKSILLILLLGGGMLAFIGFFAVLLTVMRKQDWMMYGYLIVAVITKLFMPNIVLKYGVHGAAIAFVVSLFMLAIVLLLFVSINYVRKRNYIRKV